MRNMYTGSRCGESIQALEIKIEAGIRIDGNMQPGDKGVVNRKRWRRCLVKQEDEILSTRKGR